jgi:hypothetical protein
VALRAGIGDEVKAQMWLVRQPSKIGVQNNDNVFIDYRYPLYPVRRFGTVHKSFASAVSVLAQLTRSLLSSSYSTQNGTGKA